MLASKLKENSSLLKEINMTFYWDRKKNFLSFFRIGKYFVYCCEIAGLLNAMGVGQMIPVNRNSLWIIQREE